jgi:Protein of unknown function (DUF3108)
MLPQPERVSMPVAPARRRRYWLLVTLALALATPGAWAKDDGASLQPYKARYQVNYRGLSGGQIESSLTPGSAKGQWLYETRAFPSMLARVAVSPQARERSIMQVTAEGVRPLTFDFNDGSEGSQKDVRFTFDWAAGRVRGEAQGKPFDLAVSPGTQDTASVQAAMIVALLAGQEPKGFAILTGSKLREYRYWPEGKATIVTPYGQFETVVWVNQRSGSTRLTKVWHAPALGYVPVQAVQYRKGQAETQMKLVSLTRGSGE